MIGHHEFGVRGIHLAQPQSDPAAGRAPLRGVVEQVEHRAGQARRIAVNLPTDGVDVELDVVAAPPNPLEATVDDLAHIDGLVHDTAGVVAREVHQIAYQSGQFLDLGDHVGPQFGHLALRQPRAPGAIEAISNSTLVRSDVNGCATRVRRR